jgi:hypothetical protein
MKIVLTPLTPNRILQLQRKSIAHMDDNIAVMDEIIIACMDEIVPNPFIFL